MVAVAPRAVVKTTAKKTSTRRTSTKSASKTRTKTKTATRTSSRTASRTASRSITAAFVPESEDFGGLTRDEAVRLYKTYYAIPQPAMSYTGNATSCEGGTTSDDYKKDVENRLNYYRLSAGLLPVKLNYTLSANSQYAAMMMSRNKQLSHYPPSSWACYTFDAAIQAVSSNLALGLQGRGAIDVYVNEPPGLGHRNCEHLRDGAYDDQ